MLLCATASKILHLLKSKKKKERLKNICMINFHSFSVYFSNMCGEGDICWALN